MERAAGTGGLGGSARIRRLSLSGARQHDARALKRVLMVAFHFPPLAGSSGIQRTLRFVQHLPGFGWEPIVLTAHPRVYERVADDLIADIPAGTVVRRAFALDTARDLSIGGRFLGALARPDRWMTWRFGAIPVARRIVRDLKPSVLWTTYPIATAHDIGADIHRATGLPWVADFRDPMAQDGYPADPQTWRRFRRIEETAVSLAAHSVFTTRGAARLYRERYPQRAERIRLIENGYDEESFSAMPPASPPVGPLVFLHSGIVYPSERDPTALLDALALLRHDGHAGLDRVLVRFRAAVHEAAIDALARERGVRDMVELVPPIAYREALHEMQTAHALILLQAANCNEQVPAKLYEYLRAGRPIVALTDSAGDTAEVLRRAGISTIAPLDDARAIARLVRDVIFAIAHGIDRGPNATAVRAASRLERTRELAAVLDSSAV
jgi:glycosyltransferase involved in cell wall biosynthesis